MTYIVLTISLVLVFSLVFIGTALYWLLDFYRTLKYKLDSVAEQADALSCSMRCANNNIARLSYDCNENLKHIGCLEEKYGSLILSLNDKDGGS